MKSLFYLFSTLIVFVFALTACDVRDKGYSYYMLHPDEVAKLVVACQERSPSSREEAAKCKTVFYAAKDIIAIVADTQSDPQQFGSTILNAQMQQQRLYQAVLVAEKKYNTLKSQQASEEVLRNAYDDVYKARKAYESAKQRVNIYLAVIGMASPE